ncbi:MAG: amino acid ABC transporter substrate-binding protein, partial [Candidatus Bipolaricaulia bacterium]
MIKGRWLLVIGLLVMVAVIGLQAAQLPETIKIGGPISLSGKYAKEGQQTFWGVKTAVQWINDVYGGVSIGGEKIPVEYIYYDDESKKENVTSLLQRLIAVDGVNFLLAPYSSGLTLAGAPVADSYGALYMSIGGASDRIFEQGYQYVVQTIGPGSRYQMGPLDMVRALDPEAKKVALLFEDSEFARSVLEGAKTHAADLGFEIVFERTYPKGVADLTPVLSEMAAAEPEVLIGGGHFADGQLLALQMRQLDIQVKAASILVAPTLPDFYAALGDMANGFMAPAHWEIGVTFSPETTPEGMEYFGPTQDEFISAFRVISDGDDPDYHAACGGAAILAYVKAIEQAQSLDTTTVRAAMSDLHFMSFYGQWGID